MQVTVKEITELDESITEIYNSYKEAREKSLKLKEKVNTVEDTDEKFLARGEIANLDNQTIRLFELYKEKIMVLKDVLEYEVNKDSVDVHFPYYHFSSKHTTELRAFLKDNLDCKVARGNKTLVLCSDLQGEDETWVDGDEEETQGKPEEKFEDYPDDVENIWLKNFEAKNQQLEIWIQTPFCYNSPLILYKLKVTKFDRNGKEVTKAHKYDKVPHEIEDDEQDEVKRTKIFLNIDVANTHHFVLDVKAVNKVGPSEKKSRFWVLVPEAFSEVSIIGDTKFGQIDDKLVDEDIKMKYFPEGLEDTPFIDQFVPVSLKNITDKIKIQNAACKKSTLCIVNNWQIVQWGLTMIKDDKNEFTIGPSGLFAPYSCMKAPTTFSRITLTLDSCFAVSTLCKVYSWGNNEYGQLGHNDLLPRDHPTMIESLKEERVFEVSGGDFHALALTQTGKVYNWGFRQAVIGAPITDRDGNTLSFESLGDNHQKFPHEISKGYVYDDDPAVKIETGSNNNAILTRRGKLFIWGDNLKSQVTKKEFCYPVTPIYQSECDTIKIKDISIGEEHVLLLDLDGKLYFKGGNSNSQMGSEFKQDDYREIQEVEFNFGSKIVKAYAGDCTTYVICENGDIFTAGMRLKGIKGDFNLGWCKIDNIKAKELCLGLNNLTALF